MKKHVEALRAKEEKAALKAKIAEEKRKVKLAALTPEQRAKKEERAKIAAEKNKAKWRIEETKGEAVYRSMQEALSERGRKA